MRTHLLSPVFLVACLPMLARTVASVRAAGGLRPSHARWGPASVPPRVAGRCRLPAGGFLPITPGRPLADRFVRRVSTAAGGPPPISFQDAAAYERMTGAWSRLVGRDFLDWLAPARGLRWLDVGCGNGVFTGLIADRCAPASVEGIDPEPAQLDYARRRPDSRDARFRVGDAMALPCLPASVDVAAMALVLFYLPDPAQGVAQMVRVVAPGGIVCAYNWDLARGGSPLAVLGRAMRRAGVETPTAPSAWAAAEEAVRRLWTDAGLEDVQTRRITVRREFESFEALWEVLQLGASTAPVLRGLSFGKREEIKGYVREQVGLGNGDDGPVTCEASAIAVKGRVKRS